MGITAPGSEFLTSLPGAPAPFGITFRRLTRKAAFQNLARGQCGVKIAKHQRKWQVG